MSGDFHTDADHGFPYSQDVITRLHGMAEVYRHFSQGKEVGTADLLDEAAGCISALMENMSAPSRGPYLMPLAVRLASERVRADAANTMRHDTTSDLSARLMCRVGVNDLGLVMAWVDQFASRVSHHKPDPQRQLWVRRHHRHALRITQGDIPEPAIADDPRAAVTDALRSGGRVMSRAAPDGGTANIGRDEYDDGLTVCPDCGEEVTDAELNVEAWERFDCLLCADCFESRCERLEDGE